MNNKKEMSMEELKDLLMDNEITNFDPVAEAYRVFDQHGEGALSGEKLRQAFVAYGMGELADEELDILIRVNAYLLLLGCSFSFQGYSLHGKARR